MAGSPPVRGFLVDVWETLIEPGFQDRFSVIAGFLGIDPAAWQAEWNKGRDDRDRGRLTVAGSFARTLPAFGIDPDPALVDDLVRRDRELMIQRCRLFEDAVPFLVSLRERGIAVALVSNCSDTTRPLLEYLGLIPLADAVILSCEVGSAKPFPDIYHAALGDLGVAATDAAFVDDSPSYCVGAQAVGVRAIQLTRGGAADGQRPSGGQGTSGGQDSPGGQGLAGGEAGAPRWDFPVVHSLLDVQRFM